MNNLILKNDLLVLRTSVCAFALLCAATPALGATVADTDTDSTSASEDRYRDDKSPEEIAVIGQVLFSDQVNSVKTPTPILDVPQSLTLFDKDQILERGFTSIAEIVNYTPGVNNTQGEGHRDALVFRGVRSTADFYIDGARDDVQYYRPLYNLEQVEILRGPNALLFGRGGTGGILNRVTKKGQIGESFTTAQASATTFGGFGVQLDSNFDAGEKAAFRINAMYEHLDNHRDFFEGDRIGINPTGRLLLGEATTVDVSYEYINHERFIDRGIPTGADGRPVEAFQDIVFADPTENVTTLEAHLVRAAVQHNFSENWKGNFNAFYGNYDKFYGNLYASGYDEINTHDEVTLDGYEDETQRENIILSSNLVGELASGDMEHTILVGAEYINTSSDQFRFNTLWSTTQDDNEIFSIRRPLNVSGNVGVNAAGQATVNEYGVDLNDDTRVTLNVFSAYIQDQIALADWVDLVVGARFDSFDIEVDNVVAGDVRERTDTRVSPRFGVIFKPQENVSIYGSYSESFLPRSGEQFANINGNNNQLDPNTFTNIEAGIKWDFAEGLSFTTALFEIEQSSPQVADSDPETLDIIDSTIRGFELQLTGQVTDFWFISAGYSYLDGEQVNRSGPTGLRPRELPENMFSVWNNFQITEKFGFGAGLTYQDESFVNNGNTAVLPSFTRVDAAAYYDVSENVRIQVNVENLTDELYFPNSHSTHQVTVAPPLHARFAVTARF